MALNTDNRGSASQLTAEIGARSMGELLWGRACTCLPAKRLYVGVAYDLELCRRVIRTWRDHRYYTAPFILAYLDQLQRDIDRPPGDADKRS